MPTITDFIPIYTAAAVAAVLAVTAVVFRLLTYPGAIVAAATVVLAAVFWGYAGLLIYIAPFILNAVFGFVGKKRRQAEEKFHAHTGKRGVRQVICNGAPALIMMGIAFFTRLEVFYVAAAAAVAEGFADSEAGDFGMAFGGKTVNILTFKECERGLSGGVSVVGTVAALVAAAFWARTSATWPASLASMPKPRRVDAAMSALLAKSSPLEAARSSIPGMASMISVTSKPALARFSIPAAASDAENAVEAPRSLAVCRPCGCVMLARCGAPWMSVHSQPGMRSTPSLMV